MKISSDRGLKQRLRTKTAVKNVILFQSDSIKQRLWFKNLNIRNMINLPTRNMKMIALLSFAKNVCAKNGKIHADN